MIVGSIQGDIKRNNGGVRASLLYVWWSGRHLRRWHFNWDLTDEEGPVWLADVGFQKSGVLDSIGDNSQGPCQLPVGLAQLSVQPHIPGSFYRLSPVGTIQLTFSIQLFILEIISRQLNLIKFVLGVVLEGRHWNGILDMNHHWLTTGNIHHWWDILCSLRQCNCLNFHSWWIGIGY